MTRRTLKQGSAVLVALAFVGCAWQSVGAQPEIPDPTRVQVFDDNGIHYSLEDPDAHETATVTAEDNGRVISRTMSLPEPEFPVRIVAHVAIRPIPADERHVHDPWDRAGNVRLGVPDGPDIEIVKFITAYGGATEHVVDVSHLSSVLRGECTLKGFIDTWLSPAWKMDFSLSYEPVEASDNPDWVFPLLFEEWLTEEQLRDGPITVEVSVPRRVQRVVMNYLSSGHCTDGAGPEEFETRDHIITVDGAEVHRSRPWRDDCTNFRSINPYCARWSDGHWSSDHSRSGWCPGDVVEPESVDLTDYLPPGNHTMTFFVDGIRPRDDQGHLGYWRVSAHLLGWHD